MPLFYQKTVTYLPSLSVTYLTTLYRLTVPQPYKKSTFYGEKKNIATLF